MLASVASDSGPPLRPEGLAKEERRSLPTPARLSDRKDWPRKNGARFQLRPASLTGRPGQGATALTSDSGPPLQPKGLAKEERRLLPTPARLSDQKAWPRRNGARFQLRPASPTERPGQTPLPNSDPRL